VVYSSYSLLVVLKTIHLLFGSSSNITLTISPSYFSLCDKTIFIISFAKFLRALLDNESLVVGRNSEMQI